jgi:hypothetical protein
MGIGASIFLLAVGAILAFAVSIDATPVAGIAIDWQTVGVILIVAGVIGLAWSLTLLSAARRDRDAAIRERERVIER